MSDNLKSRIDQIRTWANQNEGFIGLVGCVIGSVLTVMAIVISILSLAKPSLFQKYGTDALCTGSILLTLGVGLVLVYLGGRKYRSEPKILLSQTEAVKLSTWSPNEDWTSDQDILSVTNSMFGGICRKGTKWENYEFTFGFKIVQRCAGWIVRAKSPDHHIMIQCNDRQQIRPHVRGILEEGDIPRYKPVEEIPLRYSLDEWNAAKTVVSGHSIEVWINNNLVWSHPDLLKDLEIGTVGFRCAPRRVGEDEHALFRNIQVTKR